MDTILEVDSEPFPGNDAGVLVLDFSLLDLCATSYTFPTKVEGWRHSPPGGFDVSVVSASAPFKVLASPSLISPYPLTHKLLKDRNKSLFIFSPAVHAKMW